MTPTALASAVGCTPARAALWHPHLIEAMGRFGIEGKVEQASFIGQLAHESERFTRLVENLNYSAEGLAKTWPNRYAIDKVSKKPNRLALFLHKRPEAIANNCYAGRMGNGDEKSGDGWKYRGRGLIQITGLGMYERCGKALGIDLVANPELLTDPRYAALSAAWFWQMSGLDRFDDDLDVMAETKIINGGTNGAVERDKAFKRALAAIQAA